MRSVFFVANEVGQFFFIEVSLFCYESNLIHHEATPIRVLRPFVDRAANFITPLHMRKMNMWCPIVRCR